MSFDFRQGQDCDALKGCHSSFDTQNDKLVKGLLGANLDAYLE